MPLHYVQHNDNSLIAGGDYRAEVHNLLGPRVAVYYF